ncbi:hypothetical protein EYF80_049693 [Liparis tanakae]|uniref:Uncharacterized protein n=1 Tax=Liparis tanakae TaxID=230148 RepID=A0A4Z2FH78_9TELE|nr:hypothetical protein EYF80_049693 [Liparis tanakae]
MALTTASFMGLPPLSRTQASLPFVFSSGVVQQGAGEACKALALGFIQRRQKRDGQGKRDRPTREERQWSSSGKLQAAADSLWRLTACTTKPPSCFSNASTTAGALPFFPGPASIACRMRSRGTGRGSPPPYDTTRLMPFTCSTSNQLRPATWWKCSPARQFR